MDAGFTLINRQHYGSIFTDFPMAGIWLISIEEGGVITNITKALNPSDVSSH